MRTWSGFCHVCFITDVYSPRIVGWGASRSLKTDLTLDTLEQAIWERNRTGDGDSTDWSTIPTVEPNISRSDTPSVSPRTVSSPR